MRPVASENSTPSKVATNFLRLCKEESFLVMLLDNLFFKPLTLTFQEGAGIQLTRYNLGITSLSLMQSYLVKYTHDTNYLTLN